MQPAAAQFTGTFYITAVKKGDALLLMLLATLWGTLLLRVVVEPTGFVTPDSAYYLECAGNLLAGRGFYRSDVYPIPVPRDPHRQVFFSTWPVGYPLLIAGVARLTTLSVFWASKLLNGLLLAAAFWLLRRWWGHDAWKPALFFASGTVLEVFSATWSEVPFLVLLMAWVGQLVRHQRAPTFRTVLALLLLGWGLFLMRYVGGFVFIYTAGGAVLAGWRRQRRRAGSLWLVTAVGVAGALAYFYVNVRLGGTLTGGERLLPHAETWSFFAAGVGRALAGEWVVARSYAANLPFFSWLGGALLVQTVLLLWAGYRLHRRAVGPSAWGPPGPLVGALWRVGLVYLIAIVVARRLSPFDPLGARLLSPVTLLVGLSGLGYLARQKEAWRAVAWPVVALFAYAWFVNTPKRIVLDWLAGW